MDCHRNVKDFEWNEEKNAGLKEHRDISFEEITFYIENGGLLDSYEYPNKKRYPRQSVFVVRTDYYVYIVPYVEEDKYYFFKTIIPNSESRKKYMEVDNG